MMRDIGAFFYYGKFQHIKQNQKSFLNSVSVEYMNHPLGAKFMVPVFRFYIELIKAMNRPIKVC